MEVVIDNCKPNFAAHFCQNDAESDEEQSSQYLIYHQKFMLVLHVSSLPAIVGKIY